MQLLTEGFHAHPESARLFNELASVLEPGQLWSYQDLNAVAGIDIRTHRGRGQFYKFAKRVLLELKLHMECVPNKGYAVVKPNEHAICGLARAARAKRMVRKGLRITANARFDQMTESEAKENANLQVRLAALSGLMTKEVKAAQKEISGTQQKRLPHPLKDQVQVV